MEKNICSGCGNKIDVTKNKKCPYCNRVIDNEKNIKENPLGFVDSIIKSVSSQIDDLASDFEDSFTSLFGTKKVKKYENGDELSDESLNEDNKVEITNVSANNNDMEYKKTKKSTSEAKIIIIIVCISILITVVSSFISYLF